MKSEKLREAVRKIKKTKGEREHEIAELDAIAGYAEDMESYFNVKVDEKTVILMVLIGKYGLHIFLDIEKYANFDQIRAYTSKLVYKYHLCPQTAFWGINEALNEVYLVSAKGEIIKIDDLEADFINFDRNLRRPEAEKLRLNIRSFKDNLKTENEIENLKTELGINTEKDENETFVREILSDDMIDFYRYQIEKSDEKLQEIRVDEEGNEYKKHEKKIRFLGLTTGEAYYKMSDEDSENTFFVTLFGGIFGLHHLLRGDFIRAIMYLFTGGGFAVFYISDVISLCTGAYFYDEIRYEITENGQTKREKERVYLREISDKKKKYLGIIGAIFIGITYLLLVIRPAYNKLNLSISDATRAVTTEYLEERYSEINDIY